MRNEGCLEHGKYCGIKRHTKHLRTTNPDMEIRYKGTMNCGNCETVFEWKVVEKQIIYTIRRGHYEYVPEVESSEKQVSPTETWVK